MENDSCFLTVLTPTFNRKDKLPRLADSLNAQTDKEFQWLVIDDGSSDHTDEYIRQFQPQGFSVDYRYKENGGKHTALNYAHPYIKGSYVCVVDSDDTLTPDAVATIRDAILTCGKDPMLACFSFQRGINPNNALVKGMPDVPVISNHIDFRLNGGRFGDCCEVVRTDVLEAYPFPEFSGEHFISEGYFWVQMAKKYKTYYCSRIIYLCQYEEGGLTKSGRGMRLQSPLGGMAVCNAFLSARKKPRLCVRLTLKQTWMYICYGKYAGLSYRRMKKKCERPGLMTLNYPIGLLIYQIFRRKYG